MREGKQRKRKNKRFSVKDGINNLIHEWPQAGAEERAALCDGTSVSSHRSWATCYPLLPAKLCFLIKSIVKERLACISSFFLSALIVLFPSFLARRVTKESIVRPRVSTSSNPWLGAKTGSYPNLFGYPIARKASPTSSPFCSSSRRRHQFFFFFFSFFRSGPSTNFSNCPWT